MAPNKPNGYYFYMLHQRQSHPGWSKKGLAELSQLCSAGWTALSPEERARFQAMKETQAEPPDFRGNQRKKGDVRIYSGYAANGVRLTDIVARDREVVTKEQEERALVSKILAGITNIQDQEFCFVHCNHFGKLDHTEQAIFLPAEISLCVFSLSEGVREVGHWFPEPNIPPIYKARSYSYSKSVHGVPVDDFCEKYSQDDEIVAGIESLVGRSKAVFAFEEWKEPASCILASLYVAVRMEMPFKVLSAGELLAQVYQLKSGDGALDVIEANNRIKAQLTAFHPAIDCQWHRENLDCLHCSAAYVQRVCFGVAGVLCPLYGVGLVPGRHSLPLWSSNAQKAEDDDSSWGNSNNNDDADVEKEAVAAPRGWRSGALSSVFGAVDIRELTATMEEVTVGRTCRGRGVGSRNSGLDSGVTVGRASEGLAGSGSVRRGVAGVDRGHGATGRGQRGARTRL